MGGLFGDEAVAHHLPAQFTQAGASIDD